MIAVLRTAALLLQGIQIPAPTGLVNDFAHVIQPDAAQRMERIAEDVRAKSRGEMTIVTLPDIGTRDVQEVALQIGRQWKVGKIGNPGDPTRNAGAVILLVPKETSKDGRGHCFIATGRGAEGFITDADAGDICREATPAFAAQDYSTGLELVTLRTAQRFANEFHFSLDTTLAPPQMPQSPDNYPSGGSGQIPPFAIFIIFIVVLFILSSLRRRGGRGAEVAAAFRSSSRPEASADLAAAVADGAGAAVGAGVVAVGASADSVGAADSEAEAAARAGEGPTTEKTKQAQSRLRYEGLGV